MLLTVKKNHAMTVSNNSYSMECHHYSSQNLSKKNLLYLLPYLKRFHEDVSKSFKEPEIIMTDFL